MNTKNHAEKTSDEQWDETLNSQESLDMLDMLSDDALIGFEMGQFVPMNESAEKLEVPKIK